MTTYTLHVPADALPGEIRALDRARVVRDGFSWGAFVFTFLWFFWHRLWLAGLMVLAAVVGLQVLVAVLPVDPTAGFWAQVLVSILIGLEASTLQRWTHERRGLSAVAVVRARSPEEAEERGFAAWLADGTRPARGSGSAEAPSRPGSLVPASALGLFPDEARRR